ncbi:hypothetical protein [Arthrobacter sp. JSM 101049]|uniref:hypothetical protein n=1 Tax=Arthrobacter sp. JSM 101049 TaxID=929097 RepID=UPI003562D611
MGTWLATLQDWAAAWAAVRDRETTVDGAGVRTIGWHAPAEYILGWPGDDIPRVADQVRSHPGAMLTLVADQAEDLLDEAAPVGLVPVKRAVLLMASTAGLETSTALPENGGLEEAPMDLYEVVEATEFGRPVASGRIRVENGVAVIGSLKTHHPETGPAFGRAVLAALVEEAYVHGADTLFTIVSERQASGYTGTGWTIAAHIVTFRSTE